MKITNKTGLPGPIVAAVQNDEWSRGDADISVTELLSPPRQVAMRIHHENEIVVDAADQIFALMGKIGHGVLEHAGYDTFAEEQLTMPLGQWTLSGRMDSLYLEDLGEDQWGIDDYKFTSVYVAKSAREPGRSRVDDWFVQANLYRMIAEHHGFKIKQMRLVLLLRDWSVLAAKRDSQIPQQQVVTINVPLQDLKQLKTWAINRCAVHMDAQQGMDQYGQDHLPQCSSEETWEKPTNWAVFKKDAKRATKVESSYEDLMRYCDKQGFLIMGYDGRPKLAKGYRIEKRLGARTRCESYCDVAEFCQQFKEWRDEQEAEISPGS